MINAEINGLELVLSLFYCVYQSYTFILDQREFLQKCKQFNFQLDSGVNSDIKSKKGL
jgi:hypothetical protein